MLDTSTPNLARAYDYLLGGEGNFAADRALAGRLLPLYPGLPDLLSASRAYVAAAVTRIARQGVHQYLDIGAGLPTKPATHQAARAAIPAARVCYVDRDPEVIAHARPLLPAGVRFLHGDLAEPEALLAEITAGRLIDLTRPVCLVLGLVLQTLEPGTARAVVGVLVRAVPPGSYLVLTAGAGEAGRLPDSIAPAGFTEPDMASFFAGLDLLPPGIEAGEVLRGIGVKAMALRG